MNVQQGLVSLKRVEEYLLKEELQRQPLRATTSELLPLQTYKPSIMDPYFSHLKHCIFLRRQCDHHSTWDFYVGCRWHHLPKRVNPTFVS